MGYFDCHMHSSFSGDSETAPEEMINKARLIGLSGLCFTDHLDLDFTPEPGLFDLDLPAYEKKLRFLCEQYASDEFMVLKGIELGLKTNIRDELAAVLLENDFDFVIGSIHLVNDEDPYYKAFYEGKTATEAYRQYFSCMMENLKSFHDFDSLGHLDYVCRYGMRHLGKEEGALDFNALKDEIDEILSFIIKSNISLEVNTGSFRNNMPEPNPSYRVLSRYLEMGGHMITLGADAHKPDTIADHFDEVAERLKEIGFKSYLVYKKRRPEERPL